LPNNIIAIIFDFDITLSPEFQQQVIFDDWNVEASDFWKESVHNIANGYDMEHGYLKTLIDYGKRNPKYALNNQKLYEYGKKVNLYQGLSRKEENDSIFDDLEAILGKENYKSHNITLEFYCISGGITEMIDASLTQHNIRHYFKEIFACRMDEDENGKLTYIKETVGHTIKTQKLYMISKGVLPSNGDNPALVNEVTKHYRIPFNQMIFLGDGQTDIPVFSLINSMGGTSVAVYREEKNSDGTINEEATLKTYHSGYKLAIESKRAEQLLPADYSNGKPLKMALLAYVEKIATKIVNNA
jgi:phosphoglycolate phosphatase-like HAD superfamily hydrolase